MGSSRKKITEIRFEVSGANADVFTDFNTIRIVKGLDKESAFAELVESEVARHRKTILSNRWVKWSELETELALEGFTVNRQTVWNYRKNGKFADDVKTDGIDTLYNLDAFLAFFSGKELSSV